MQHPSGIHQVRYGERLPADIGDALTIDGNAWVVIANEPPFEQRRIEPARLHAARDDPKSLDGTTLRSSTTPCRNGIPASCRRPNAETSFTAP
jgi:hypothetical protein